MKRRMIITLSLIAALMLTAQLAASADQLDAGSQADGNTVSSVSKAPIVPDGTTAGAATDFVITFDRSLDPNVEGRSLDAGKKIRVTLPQEFVNTGTQELRNVGEQDCVPGNLQCNTGVLLQGWPQHPIGPPKLKYSLAYEGTHTIVFTALQDIKPMGPAAPGIKQIHLILTGWKNPGPGQYRIMVEAETGLNGEVERGRGTIHIVPKSRPSINVTSAFNPGTPNTIYQTAEPGELTQFAYDFLLWGWRNEPFVDVGIRTINPGHSVLLQGRRVVGHVFVDAPAGATGQEITIEGLSSPTNAPILGVPTARLTANFRAGSATGEYIVTFELNGGNSVQMFVRVE